MELKVKDCVLIKTKFAFVSGMLIGMSSFVKDDMTEETVYHVLVDKNNVVKLNKSEMVSIELIDAEESIHFFQKLQEEKGVKCFDSDNKKLSNSVIMGNMLAENKWDNLTEDEKRKFVDNICFDDDDIVKIINVLFDYKYENQKIHDRRMKALDMGINALEKFEEIKRVIPEGTIFYDFIFKQLQIKDLIESI